MSKEVKFAVPVAEGAEFQFLGEETINPSFLQTFSFESPAQLIVTETDEFSAVCPFSGLPDLAHLRIEYYPSGGRCIELKSLKYYITSFRNVGIYQEAATKRIREDLETVLNCPVRVQTIYNIRGGFKTTCTEGALSEPPKPSSET
ncbi:MAG: preQ(1) synthase [Bdellovibrionales bacterium]|nr:preQ(1) synthase [Bdellovibrionales bacterium]